MSENNMKAKDYLLLGIGIVSIVLSLIAICNTYPRTSEFGIDYQGWIVGILSFLVTILIGWQIFSIIDIRGIRKEIYLKENDIYQRSELNIAEFHLGMFMVYINMWDQGCYNTYELLHHGLLSLAHQSKIGLNESSNQIIALIMERSPKIKKERLTQEQMKALISLLPKIQNPACLRYYIDLCGLLSLLQGIDPQD